MTALEKQQQTEADKKEQEKQVVRGHQRVNDKKQEELRQKVRYYSTIELTHDQRKGNLALEMMHSEEGL